MASHYTRFHALHDRPVVRYIRINPTGWRNKICLRVEVYGCSLGANRSKSIMTTITFYAQKLRR